jgi:hypothetical protein
VQNNEFPLKVIINNYEVIHSGIAHMTGSEIKFELANLVVLYRFKKDSGEGRYEGEVGENNTLIINLYNSSNSLGEGKIEPVEIGTLGGKRLYGTWFVSTISNDLRQFHYTFMLAED